MKTITINVYSFNELSEKSKRAALMNLSDLNTMHNWWEGTYEDAATIGLKITSFDIDSKKITAELVKDEEEIAALIIQNHGEDCNTRKTAENYLAQKTKHVSDYSDGVNTEKVAEGNEDKFDYEMESLDTWFLKTLLNDYLNILKKEEIYLTSEAAIIESIEANEYLFFEEGKLIPTKYYAMIPGNEAF